MADIRKDKSKKQIQDSQYMTDALRKMLAELEKQRNKK